MNTREASRLVAQIDAVVEQIAVRLPAAQAAAVSAFTARFFAQVDPEDLEVLPVADLYGAVLRQWQFIAPRRSGSRVGAFNPRLD